ncbi:tyrosine-protein phosphatase [Haliea sp. E17]|uniref:tyrosine-protein phosphatase n=1 Tax=Haliea sp. E17 TaxID=3401576 RepID=UPI003AADC9A1
MTIRNLVALACVVLAGTGMEAFAAGTAGVPVGNPRLLPLEGGRNFRDVGGYPAGEGMQVKWGKLYRSGTLYALTDNDFALLDERDIAVIADLRSNEERAGEPTMWRVDEPEILSWAYSQGDTLGGMRELFSQEGLTPADVTQVMAGLYREMPGQQASHYRDIFDQLADNRLPLVVHCSAGKDRTGVGIGLILTALGVPREVILEDYAMSEKYQQIPVLKGKDYQFEEGDPLALMAALPQELVAPLMGSNPVYLESAFAAIEEQHGSVMAYIQGELEVSDEELAQLRANLLEPLSN